jgi:hypothetical protein
LSAGRALHLQGAVALPPPQRLHPDTQQLRCLSDPIAIHRLAKIQVFLVMRT